MYPQEIPIKSLPQTEGIGGLDDLRRVAAFQVGAGNRTVKMDGSGLWLGANKFADAPFSVNLDGDVIASSATFSSYALDADLDTLDASALKKTGADQPLTGDIRVGAGANVKLDGANARILINDGSDDRILIGFQSGGF